jgi:hypothetical protein
MSCAHCCHNYGNGKKGKHMPLDMFRKIMKYASDNGDMVTIGGGEICLYPDFEAMIGIIACYADKDMPPFIVTNGSITDRALLLNRLAKGEIIGCELSQDEFHNPIEWEVIEAFRARDAIRDVTRHGELMNHGRAKSLDHYNLRNECMCDAMQFYPTGVVKWCGCAKSPTITRDVMNDFDLPSNYNHECYKNAEELAEAV